MMSGDEANLLLIDLPDMVLEIMFSNLTYDEIARNRLVCKTFNIICKKLLNRGFNSMEKYHAQCLRAVKSQLPRRESERRSHPLSRHCDILTAIETRISMLSMTFTKYMDLNLCCFIPGKVIDEIFRVLRLIRISKSPPRTPEILQELRDISSMAMEHFDEKILPDFKNSLCHSSASAASHYDSLMSHHQASHSKVVTSTAYPLDRLNQTFKRIYSRTKRNKKSMLCVRGQVGKMKLRMNRQGMQVRLQSIKLQEHSKKIQEQDAQLADMKKHLEDWEQKLADLSAELSRARDDAQKQPSTDPMDSCKRAIAQADAPIQKESKKRKLIVDRKFPSDAHHTKFKKFMSELLLTDRDEAASKEQPSTSE